MAKSVSLFSAELVGLEVPLVEVEVHASHGLPHVDIVGLAEPCVRESKQRVRAAIVASGFRFPEEKLTINLAPASLKKMGTGFDLAIAIGILLACGKIEIPDPEILKSFLLVGELSLSGGLRPMQGTLNVAIAAKERKFSNLILPVANAREAGLVSELNFFPAHNLQEVIQHLQGLTPLSSFRSAGFLPNDERGEQEGTDLCEIRGQSLAKKALIIAAAGGHNLLFIGPPGSGKTLLARSFPKLLPNLGEKESFETTRVHSAAGLLNGPVKLLTRPPFRSPHHSVTDAGLIGGGKFLTPGEISLAHNGVLFLDELPEFQRHVLEILREPLESGQVHLARANGSLSFPAQFQLIAAMNPCPCGYAGVDERICHCSQYEVRNYTKKISGPLLDRIDLRLHLQPVAYHEFFGLRNEEDWSTDKACQEVIRVREVQAKRFQNAPYKRNAKIPTEAIEKYCPLSEKAKKTFLQGLSQKQVSARGIHRILRLARTLADLNGEDHIISDALFESFTFWQTPAYWT